MRILLDTKILLRLDDALHARHEEAVAATEWLGERGHESPTPTPEPTSLVLIGMGATGVVFGGIRQRRAAKRTV